MNYPMNTLCSLTVEVYDFKFVFKIFLNNPNEKRAETGFINFSVYICRVM